MSVVSGFPAQSSWTDPRDGAVVAQTQFTPLHVAAQEDCAAAVEALLSLGAAPDAEGGVQRPGQAKILCGVRPLHVASRGGCLSSSLVLLRHAGCVVDAPTSVW